MGKTHGKKFGIEKFTVAKINNQKNIFGGSTTDDGPITIRPTTNKTRPTRPTRSAK